MKRKNNKFAYFGSYLRHKNSILFTLILVALTTVVNIVVTTPVELGWIKDIEFFPTPDINDGMWMLFFTAVIVAPLFETLCFQMFPYWVLHRFRTFRYNRWAIVLIAALIFGSMHYYSVMYIVAATCMGAVMMYGYIVKWRRHGYWNLVLFHAVWNTLVLGMELAGLE